MTERVRIPRDPCDDYTEEMAAARRRFVAEQTGAGLAHVGHYSIDPAICRGNIENFIGVAQVPIGVAGPLRIDGEHAAGRLLRPAGDDGGHAGRQLQPGHAAADRERRREDRGRRGLHATRAGVHTRRCRRGPRLRPSGSRSTSTRSSRRPSRPPASGQPASHRPVPGRPAPVPPLQLHDRRRRRAEHDRQGDARGVHMDPGELPGRLEYMLSGNIDTDKKHSGINMLLTRGKRVVAEAVIKNDVLKSLMGVEGHELFLARQISNVGIVPRRQRQQRRPLRQRPHRDVHRHRSGRGQHLRVPRRRHVHASCSTTATTTGPSRSPR